MRKRTFSRAAAYAGLCATALLLAAAIGPADENQSATMRDLKALEARVSRLEAHVGRLHTPIPTGPPLVERVERLERDIQPGHQSVPDQIDKLRDEVQKNARLALESQKQSQLLERRVDTIERTTQLNTDRDAERMKRQIDQMERELRELRQDVQRLNRNR